MRRHLPRLLLTGALLSPATLYALGLGEIHLNSALNQPFDAEIELIAPTREELAELKVGLASNELFTRYGLDRPAFLSNFEFLVSRNREGQVSIKVTSNRSVTEPFVTLLVEASWGRGRLLREYTVLLDPPVFMPSQPGTAAPVTAPQSGARNEGRIERAPTPQPEPAQTRPVPAPQSVTEEPTASKAVPAAVGGTYNVERNDTLWRIASSVQPGAPRRVVNQTMIALFRANPQAFGGNINRLLAGSVLRIPDLSDISSISTTEAAAEVARQQEAWSGATRDAAAAAPESRLRLVPPQEAAPATAPTPAQPAAAAPGTPGSPAPGSTAAGSADKRLAITSPGLSDVQKGVDKTPAATQPPTPAAEPQPQPAPEQTAPAPVAEQPAPPPKPAPKPANQVEAPAGPSFMERIGDFWWVPVAAGLLLVVGLLLAFLRRRREEADATSLDSFPPMSFEPRAEHATATVSKGRDRETFTVEGEDEEPAMSFDMDDEPAQPTARRSEAPKTRPVAPPAEVEPRVTEDTLSSESAVRFDQQDALAEADFHMAYGLYDQAADLVKIAIDREPQRRDLKLKLLEIYFVWGNRELFLDTARELHGSRDQGTAGEWDKVLIMGKQIAPEDSMFKGEAGAAHVDLVDVNLEGGENRVDVDLFAEPESGQSGGLDLEFGSGERKVAAAPESDLDFLLDEPADEIEEEPTREMDPLARTQETPTIESPALERSLSDRNGSERGGVDRTSQTIRDKVDKAAFARNAADQTAELSLDDLGLDVDALESTGALEETASLEKDVDATIGATMGSRSIRDDEMTQLAPSLSSFDRTLEAPRVEKFDIESTGTIYIDQVDLGGGDTVEQPRPDVDSTASMRRPQHADIDSHADLDVDLDNFGGTAAGTAQTVRYDRKPEAEVERFSDDVFADRTSEFARIDLDVGDALSSDDHAPTNKQVITTEMELSELEPVTMSEVGTKLDLARAYMDMGDPDGARSILEEVLAEGSANQKQEAQRLLDSIR
ncbi:MAG TPA: FimV/HubP family polar landmark protein [Steroidobacteraceae bacterium]